MHEEIYKGNEEKSCVLREFNKINFPWNSPNNPWNQVLFDIIQVVNKFDSKEFIKSYIVQSQTSDEATKEEENIFNKFPNSKKTSSLISNKNKSTFNSPPQKYVNSISIIPSSVKTRASSFHPPKTDFPSNSPFYIRSQSSVSVNNRWSLAAPGNLKNETLWILCNDTGVCLWD